MSQSGRLRVTQGVLPPMVPIQFTTDAGVAIPALGNLNVFGVINAAGADPFSTSGVGDTLNINIQTSQAIAASNATNIGLSAFNSAQFTVDANGFVSTSGTGVLNTLTGNTGVATPVAGNINVITANTTVKFSGAVSTLTEDFGLSNLLLGDSGTGITSASANVFVGQLSGTTLTSGQQNVCVGFNAGNKISSGSDNVFIGYVAGTISTGAANLNTGIGANSLNGLTSGQRNTCLGSGSGSNYTTENDNICIKNIGGLADANTIRIGTQGTAPGQQNQTFIAGVINTVSGRVVKVTTPGAYPYATLITDYLILVDSSAARTINPIAAPVTGTTYRIKDNVGSAAANNITITPTGKNIDGAASFVINTNYGSVDICYNGTEWSVL